MKVLLTSLLASTTLAASAGEWENSFNLGSTVSKGNSDSAVLTAGFSIKKNTGKHELAGSFTYTYGEESGEVSNDEVLADARWNRILKDRFYAGIRADFRSDVLADIDYRLSVSSVAGYHFIKNDKTSLVVEAGIGLSAEQVGSVDDSYISSYLGQRFEHKFDNKTRLYQKISINAPIDEVEDFSFVGEIGVETALSEALSLKVYIQDKFENDPAGDLKKNDFKLVTGITYKF